MPKALLCAAVCLSLVAVTYATYGLDLSAGCDTDTFICLVQNSYMFAIPRVYMSDGEVDPNGAQSIDNAWSGGMAHVDGYMFPCPTCGDPAGQVSDCVNNLRNSGTTFGMLWLDIEGTDYWMDVGSNVAFFEGMVQQAQGMGIVLGVYTSYSQWNPIMGDYTGGSAFPIWYAHYDGDPSFDDWSPFNGWQSPAIKQYAGDDTVCSFDIDDDWYPDSDSRLWHVSGRPNYTEWAIRWPRAFNVPGALRDLRDYNVTAMAEAKAKAALKKTPVA